jgi:predicted nucleic acid-binding protein
MLVLDASVAIKWFKQESGSDAAERLVLLNTLVAPDLLLAEVGNASRRAVRLGLMTEAQMLDTLHALQRYVSDFGAIGPLIPRALAIARDLDHPIYDCIYIALAEREGAPLVTADRRLLARVAGTAWAGTVRPLAAFA